MLFDKRHKPIVTFNQIATDNISIVVPVRFFHSVNSVCFMMLTPIESPRPFQKVKCKQAYIRSHQFIAFIYYTILSNEYYTILSNENQVY